MTKQAPRRNRPLAVGEPEETARFIRRRTALCPRLGIVLGSGFGGAAGRVQVEVALDFGVIPGFPPAGVGGHRGCLVLGHLGGGPIALLQGRAHYYEGLPMSVVTFPVRVLAALGLDSLLLTNAAGGLDPRLRPGDFMGIRDHINWMGANPLRGSGNGEGFLDLTGTYDAGLRRMLARAAKRRRIRLRWGVYVAVPGPTYETPAEVRALRRLGGDAVGMSTVPEAIVARRCDLRVAALSIISNRAAGLGQRRVSHEEVLDVGQRLEGQAAALLEEFAHIYSDHESADRDRSPVAALSQ